MPRLGLGLRIGNNKVSQGVSYASSYTTALVAQAATDGYTVPSASVLSALDTMLAALTTAGLDSRLDVLYIFATDGDRNFAKYNVLDPTTYNCTEIGTPTFTALQGFDRNGGANGLNTNFNPSTNGVNYIINSSSFAFWWYDPVQSLGINQFAVGTGTSEYSVILNSTNANTTYRINGVNSGSLTYPGTGLIHVNRNSPTLHKVFYQGVQADQEGDNSTTIDNETFKICGNSSGANTVAIGGATGHISLFWAGDDLEAEAGTINTILSAYMAAL